MHQAGELKLGDDLADYILTHLHEYKPSQPVIQPAEPLVTPVNIVTAPVTHKTTEPVIPPEPVPQDTWDKNLSEALDSFGIQVHTSAPVVTPVQPLARVAVDNTKIDNDLIYSSTPNVPKPADMWQVQNLTKFFDTIELPPALPSLKIIDLPLYVSGNIAAVTRYNGFRTFEPYLNRLLQVKAILTGSTYIPNTLPCK